MTDVRQGDLSVDGGDEGVNKSLKKADPLKYYSALRRPCYAGMYRVIRLTSYVRSYFKLAMPKHKWLKIRYPVKKHKLEVVNLMLDPMRRCEWHIAP